MRRGVALFSLLIFMLAAQATARDRAPRAPALVADPSAIIDLPPGFSYKIVGQTGMQMSDGLRVPALPDGMGAFSGPDGTTIVVCNHESKYPRDGAFPGGAIPAHIDTMLVYDRAPAAGSTTTIVWDTRTQTLVRRYLSLAGTLFNCSGGTTPWGSWLSCEEKPYRAGWSEGSHLRLRVDHGYVFEIPALADGGLTSPVPLVEMGRFTHESVLLDPRTGIIYQTEDLLDGLFYRFIPREAGNLRAGGTLQALVVDGVHESNNRVPGSRRVRVGESFATRWIEMDHVDAPANDLRRRGYDRGACRFDRGEGLCMVDGAVYFTCTMGGPQEHGQIWRYVPSKHEGSERESRSPGRIELFYEASDPAILVNPDNVTSTPRGRLLVCEDPEYGGQARIVIFDRRGRPSTVAASRKPGELTGPAFSPDGTTLFVNMQKPGITLAVTGPWETQ